MDPIFSYNFVWILSWLKYSAVVVPLIVDSKSSAVPVPLIVDSKNSAVLVSLIAHPVINIYSCHFYWRIFISGSDFVERRGTFLWLRIYFNINFLRVNYNKICTKNVRIPPTPPCFATPPSFRRIKHLPKFRRSCSYLRRTTLSPTAAAKDVIVRRLQNSIVIVVLSLAAGGE